MSLLLQDTRYAIRRLCRTPVFSLFAVAILALGPRLARSVRAASGRIVVLDEAVGRSARADAPFTRAGAARGDGLARLSERSKRRLAPSCQA